MARSAQNIRFGEVSEGHLCNQGAAHIGGYEYAWPKYLEAAPRRQPWGAGWSAGAVSSS
jgi:hypothetical protein